MDKAKCEFAEIIYYDLLTKKTRAEYDKEIIDKYGQEFCWSLNHFVMLHPIQLEFAHAYWFRIKLEAKNG